ncbi:hypothetical protein ABE087_11400, partial [Niallia taxi]
MMNLQDKIDESYPRYYNYEVETTKEQWKVLLQDNSVFNEKNLEHMKCIYSFDNHASTCKEVSEKLGGTAQYFIGLGNALAKRVARKLNITNLPIREDNDSDVYWYIIFLGQNVNKERSGNFEWKLRPSLAEALEELYPDLEYPKPIIMKKLEDVLSAVWLATATLAFEAYHLSTNLTVETMYFKQKEIQNRAQNYCGKNVENARISQWYNADHDNHTYNFLRQGEDATRRLSYPGEFNGIKEQPELNEENYIQTTLGVKAIGDIIRFIESEYTALFATEDTNNLMDNIECISILDYLEAYGGQAYESPERVDESKRQHYCFLQAK